ncbi:hypothetical protein PVAND_007334 [Polypedilum vanderplanki]|uniref:Uncharacterized protein n=1 Tax=Polypedilum vanderplanki TaxID=319348 RepID=A0A9J6C667_POLVA|nr:hypothetical protein PVAND_007334 [Polypedilum vanderplanki]
MNAGKFTLFLQLLSTILLINCVMSYDKQNESEIDNAKDVMTTEWMNKAFVATTPSIKSRLVERSSSEEDDDDDIDDNDDVNHTPTQSTNVPQLRQTQSNGGGNSVALMVINALSEYVVKSVTTAFKNHPPQFGRSSSSDEEYYQENEQDSSKNSGRSSSTIITNDTKPVEVFEGRQAGGSYIKGDPLNGYYDFVITEGSYKFWVVFQLFTAGLLIYSTLAAIYYSKVNPLTSDYDYIDYFSRSFHGRSMDSEDVEDDDGSTSSSSTDRTAIESGRTYLSSLAHNKWVRTAAYGFQFAMDAIDRIPQ